MRTKCQKCRKSFTFEWPASHAKYCSKECRLAGYRKANRKKLAEKSREWVEKNRLRRLEIQRKWNNSPKGKASKAKWYGKNKQVVVKKFLAQYRGDEQFRKESRGRTNSRKYLVKSGRKRECERCGSTERLQCHHKDENPTNRSLDNLQWLCNGCHSFVHSEHGRIEQGIISVGV